MGGLNSKEYNVSEQSEFLTAQQFNRVQNATRNSIYSSRITNNDRNSQYLKRIIPFAESSEYITNYMTMLQQVGKLVQSQNLYLPVICNIKGEQTACNDYRKLQLFYQNYDVKITDEIIARKKEGQMFGEEEVWYILYSILNACRKFQRFNMSSGDLKTENILLNDKGHVKIINKLSWPNNPPMHKFVTVTNFFSPQQLRVMRQKVQKVVNPNISQTFSIAIIILQICTFINAEKMYNMHNLRLNDMVIKKAEDILASKYSKLLANLIKTMLSNAYDRPLPSQIYSAFKPYQRRILSLKPFKFDASYLKQTLPMSNVSYY